MYIILDTETIGLPNCVGLPYGSYYNYKKLDKYESSRIVQLSYMICDDNFNEIIIKDFIIKRNNFDINNSEFHNITNEISDNGSDFMIVANEFYKDLQMSTIILAHNAMFDINVLKSELYRNNLDEIIEELEKKVIICTMQHTKLLVNAKNKYGKIKNPSLAELYYYACKENINNQHNSKYDVINLYQSIKNISVSTIL